jgi:hypothetical protein
MPSSKTVTDFAVQIQRIGTAVQKSQKDAVMRASMIVKNSIEGELVKAVGADQAMSNMVRKKGQKPPRMTLGFSMKGTNNPTSLLIARGPWGLVEYGAGKHKITPRLTKTGTGKGMSRVQRQRAIRQRELDQAFGASGLFSGRSPMPMKSTFRYSAEHPGSKGKQPFHKGLERSRDRAVKELQFTVSRSVATIIRSGRETYTYIQGEGAGAPYRGI